MTFKTPDKPLEALLTYEQEITLNIPDFREVGHATTAAVVQPVLHTRYEVVLRAIYQGPLRASAEFFCN